MKTQLEQLKQELREFIELSKTITPGKWAFDPDNRGGGTYPHYGIIDEETGASIPVHILTNELKAPANATFITQCRNISPSMAECLLGQIEWMEQYAVPVESANQQLQQILTIWEAAK